MQRVHLICNAHIDPVWQWEWDEGLGVALSTFKIAADFCEKTSGFIFNHNEAIIYEWIKEYDIVLFNRIQNLVAEQKWHIMGGWYLQPDCNMPSGETLIREITIGHKFFIENFGVFPKTAVNFDTFGHSRGLVQIIQKAGYKTYMFMRPDKGSGMLEELPQHFIWSGFGNASIPAYRLETQYGSNYGIAEEHIVDYINSHANSDVLLKTWGIGNHGGGPSAKDLDNISNLIHKSRPEIEIFHSTPDAFFDECNDFEPPIWNMDINPMFIGCYTSMHDIKKRFRELENKLFMTEKSATIAASQGFMNYPFKEFEQINKVLVTSAFHDTLAGTLSKKPEQDSLRSLCHALEMLSKISTKAFYSLASCQKPAEKDSMPIFIYNPHPYPVKDIFECEYTLPDYNWEDYCHIPVINKNGRISPCQTERESGNVPIEYRKRVVFEGELKPMCMERYDCYFEKRQKHKLPVNRIQPDYILINSIDSSVKINTSNGLIDSYMVNGIEIAGNGFCELVVFEDNVDPWAMGIKSICNRIGSFTCMDNRKTAKFAGISSTDLNPVRIVEDGPVRTVVESLLGYEGSFARVLYKIPKNKAFIDIEITLYWNEKDKLVRLSLPTCLDNPEFIGQTMFGVNKLKSNAEEMVHQKWAAVVDSFNNTALTVMNDSVYGLSCIGSTVQLSLLRSPAYAAMPVLDREILPQNRFSHRIDQGEKEFQFRIQGGTSEQRLPQIDIETQTWCEKPHVINLYPSSPENISQICPLRIEGARLETFIPSAEKDYYLIRLFNTKSELANVHIQSDMFHQDRTVVFEGYQFKTFKIGFAGFYETDLYENRI